MARTLAIALCAALAGCSGDAASSTGALGWVSFGEVSVDDQGRTPEVSVPYAAAQRFLALRATPQDGGGALCWRAEPLGLGSGRLLAPDAMHYDAGASCDTCTEALVPRRDGALAILPVSTTPLDASDALWFQIVARDCALGVRVSRARVPAMTTRLAIEFASELAHEAAAARLTVRVARGAGVTVDEVLLAQAWTGVVARFAEVGIEIDREDVGAIVGGSDLRVPLAASEQLRALDRDLIAALSGGATDRRFVPVLLSGCATVDDVVAGPRNVLGVTTEIPGLVDAGASFVALSMGQCGVDAAGLPWPPETGAAIWAHELGHFLGLFHTETAIGAVQAGEGGHLMDADVVARSPGQTRFSATQGAILRRHPAVRLEVPRGR